MNSDNAFRHEPSLIRTMKGLQPTRPKSSLTMALTLSHNLKPNPNPYSNPCPNTNPNPNLNPNQFQPVELGTSWLGDELTAHFARSKQRRRPEQLRSFRQPEDWSELTWNSSVRSLFFVFLNVTWFHVGTTSSPAPTVGSLTEHFLSLLPVPKPSLEQSTHRPQDCYLFNGRFQTSLEDLAFQKGLRLTFRLLLLQLFYQCFIIIIIIIVVIIAIITIWCYVPSVFTCIVGGAVEMTVLLLTLYSFIDDVISGVCV